MSAAEPVARWRRLGENPFVRRLPLLLVAAVGFFFLLPKVPHEVELDYDLGGGAAGLQTLSLEVVDASGTVLRRSVLKGDAARHPVQRLRLAKGQYRVDARLEYADRVDRRTVRFGLEDADRLDLALEAR